MDCVLQIATPLRQSISFLALRGRTLQLVGKGAQIIKQNNQIAHERLVERFVEKIIAVFQQLIVEGIEQSLIEFRLRSSGLQ